MLEEQLRYVENLPQNIKESLILYTDEKYIKLNEYMRFGGRLPTEYQEIYDNIHLAFDNVPVLINSMTVYRGIRKNISIKYEGKYMPYLKSFISTSTSLNEARDFSGDTCCMLRILLSSGSKVLPLSTISEHPEEMEILLSDEGEFIITNVVLLGTLETYDITYIPKNFIIHTNITTNNELNNFTNELSDDEWKSRILSLVSEEEAELFGEETIDNIVSSFDETIPPNAIKMAKISFRELYG